MTCGENLVVWDSEVDGQMDGCAQGCVKEGALKIGFLSPRPLRGGRLKNNRKIKGSLKMKRERERCWRVITKGPCQRKCWIVEWLFFSCLNSTPHYSPIATPGLSHKGGGVASGCGGGGQWHVHTHTPKHTFPSRQAVTARLVRQDEVPVRQM